MNLTRLEHCAAIIAAFAVIAVIGETSVRAQNVSAEAEALFRQGRDLMAAGRFGEACRAFEASQRLEPALTTLLNLAGCREKNGQIASAWGLFLDAERQTRTAVDPATRQLHDVAVTRSTALEPRVSKLTINVSSESRIDHLELTRDGERLDDSLWNRALPVDGGTYTITARAPGTSAWISRITVGPEHDTQTVDIPKLQSIAAVATPPARQGPAAPSPRSLVWPVTMGVGALAFGGAATALELWGASTYDRAKAEMTSQTRRDDLYQSANYERYAAEASAVAGIACAGAAIWLYVRDRDEPTTTARLLLAPSPSGLAIAGRF